MGVKFAFWSIAALLLFAAEAMAPGAFMLWFGFAAAAMAVVVLALPELGWVWQAILFSLFAFISVVVYRKWFRGRGRAMTWNRNTHAMSPGPEGLSWRAVNSWWSSPGASIASTKVTGWTPEPAPSGIMVLFRRTLP